MLRLLSKSYHAGFGVRVGYSTDVHVVVQGEVVGAREFVRMMVLGRPEDHYKLLP